MLRPSTAGLWLLTVLTAGCAAITNPVADGIPVRRLPEEVFGESRGNLVDLPLNLLRQKKPPEHLLDAEDVLGVFIENILGERNQVPPVRVPEFGNVPPSVGFPVPVQADGNILLPYIDPLPVKGLTVPEARELIRKTYTSDKRQLLPPGKDRIIVTLLQPRRYHVLVIRQDGGAAGGPQGNVQSGSQFFSAVSGSQRRGTGAPLDLQAYENDVLNALARTGGMPGTDAKNEIVIQRGAASDLLKGDMPTTASVTQAATNKGDIIRIPLRLRPGDPIPFRPDEVILQNGDIVYLETRETEVFYTAGLLGTGQFPLPRDYDLDVIQAVAQVRGPLVNGGFTQTSFVAQSVSVGLGNPSPSLLTILRPLANGQQVPIRVDLNLALRDPRERIRILPGDVLVLQEKPAEAVARYVTAVFRVNLFGFFVRRSDLQGTGTLNVP
jgi:protein involved in polysaccharide export with SLBB domain